MLRKRERINRQRQDDEIRNISSMQNTAYCMVTILTESINKGQSEAPLGSKEIA
jgi:hypothetical protein